MSDEGVVLWRTLADEATTVLEASGSESPAVDVRRMVEQATGCEPAEYHATLGSPATRRAVAAFDRMLARRRAGEPLQYVIGHWGFRELDLVVDSRVLIPRPETEVVVDHALVELDGLRDDPRARLTAVDLGTGSGAIACSIASERERVEVWATDASADALALARANVTGLGRAATRVRLIESNWFAGLPTDLRGEVDLVVTNPPYVASDDDLPAVVRDWEPTSALIAGPTGAESISEILAEAPRWLSPRGVLVAEISPAIAETTRRVATKAGFGRVEVEADQYDRERVLIAGQAAESLAEQR